MREFYRSRRVMVTGGLGFIGSNLVLALREAGASVTVVDSMVARCGANLRNIEPAGDRVRLIQADIGDAGALEEAVRDREVIFNLAGEISHTLSLEAPERDLDLNTRSQLRFVELCGHAAPGARLVYASSRQVYGAPERLPVDETHPVRPVDVNGVHKLAAEHYHRLASTIWGMETVCLRLTNVYGPRQALNLPWQGFIGVFVARALTGRTIQVFGDGAQLRDMLYVDDVVEAFLLAGATAVEANPPHDTFNIGGPASLPLCRIAELVAPGGPLERVPFPPQRLQIDIGSFRTDDRRFRRWTGWASSVRFEDGIARTLAFYRERGAAYPIL